MLVPLDEASVRRVADRLRDGGITSVAICLLHAYLNPAHERRVAEILREAIPDVAVSLSSVIAPEIREYPRASTTVANAYVGPVVGAYIASIEAGLRDRGADAGLWLMKSNGGLATAADALERPVEIIESGPAAGLAAAAFYAELVGSRDVVTFDMGGTTAKVGMIEDGEARQTSSWELGSGSGSGSAVAHASGLPILGSVMDLVEIGAGGGSIAWIDAGGILRVGPAERRCGPRAGRLRPRRHGADGHRCQPVPRPDRRDGDRGWPAAARSRGRGRRHRWPRRPSRRRTRSRPPSPSSTSPTRR